MMKNRLLEIEDFCLKKIDEGQLESGEFKTFLFFPDKSENGWIYAGPSVFLTTSIAITIHRSTHVIAQKICSKASKYVKSQMELGGLWRFYPHHGLFKFNTPMDIDDTSLASYFLLKSNVNFPDNKALLYNQITRKGDFYIWFLPRVSFLKNIKLFFSLVFDIRYSFPVFFPLKGRTSAPLISYYDTEHAVNANALLYLGEHAETKKAINHLVEDLLFGNAHNQFFYPGVLYTYYHVSRLYDEQGIMQIENLKNKVENYFNLELDINKMNIQDKAVAVLTLLNFKLNVKLINGLMEQISNTPTSEIEMPYGYFCTKDRNMIGGCKEFTCAIIAEAPLIHYIILEFCGRYCNIDWVRKPLRKFII